MAATALTVHTRSLVLEGRPFGATGAYEKIAGTLRFAVDPAHGLHAAITDLDRAPRAGPDDGRGLRQRLPHASRLRGGVDRLAARRAAPGRADGPRRAAGRRCQRARALRLPAERANRRAAARRSLSRPEPRGRP